MAAEHPAASHPCERCGQYFCTCTGGPLFTHSLADLAVPDPMVPKGYIEVRDAAGKLLSRHKIGGDRG